MAQPKSDPILCLRHRLIRAAVSLAVLPLLAACENSATAYVVDTNQHALILVREQPYFWTSTVNQAVIVSRLPYCQKKVKIHPGGTAFSTVEVYEAGDRLWALLQDGRWYLASTDRCLVQDWDNPGGMPPGQMVGSFRLKDGEPVFEAAAR